MDNVRPFYLIAVDGLKDEYLCRDDFVIDPALRVAPANFYFPSLSTNDGRPLVLRRLDPRGECVGLSGFDADYVQQFVARLGIVGERKGRTSKRTGQNLHAEQIAF